MPFPFLPGGAILAVAFLVGVLTLFGLGLRLMDRAIRRVASDVRDSMVPGIVAGLRGWGPSTGHSVPSGAVSPEGLASSAIEIVDLDGSDRPPGSSA